MTSTIKEYFKDANEKEMLYQANKIAGSIQKANYLGDDTKKAIFDNEIDEKSKEGSFRILVIDSSGVVVNDSNKTDIGMTYILPEVIVALDGKDTANLREEEGVIYASAYIENDSSEKIGIVLLVSSFEDVFMLLEDISHKWIILFVAASVIIGIGVLITSNVMVIEPLKSILSSMEKITDGQLHNRVVVKGHDEFSELGTAFNNMTEELEQVESTRQEFVSNVSHELKTPLSSIKILSDSILLQDDVPVEMYNEFLQDINSEIDRMTNIVNDLLALVKLDHREAGLNIKETDINKMVEDLIKRLTPLADHKLIDIIYENNKKVDIEADEMKLTLAISNLIENAIKYTPDEGSVTIIVDGDHQNAFISVIDTGIGISEEEQSKVFKRFYRVDKTRDRETGGTGLGLAITHATVMLHNGSIKLTSKEGQGSSFVVRLPIKHSGN
ncbi:MAG: HAMP domain-containing histidine kinase [Firmicutes bacterium]|nr:HAMP domain-containing histidine kinase [Bacillota bacterium]